jgi:hypothetical protein
VSPVQGLAGLGASRGQTENEILEQLKATGGQIDNWAREYAKRNAYEATGVHAYRDLAKLLDSEEAASRALAEAGIPGLRYFDAGSQGKGEGSRNVVMFPGAEHLINIDTVE